MRELITYYYYLNFYLTLILIITLNYFRIKIDQENKVEEEENRNNRDTLLQSLLRSSGQWTTKRFFTSKKNNKKKMSTLSRSILIMSIGLVCSLALLTHSTVELAAVVSNRTTLTNDNLVSNSSAIQKRKKKSRKLQNLLVIKFINSLFFCSLYFNRTCQFDKPNLDHNQFARDVVLDDCFESFRNRSGRRLRARSQRA